MPCSRVLIAGNNKGRTTQDVAYSKDVKAGLIAAACRIIQHWKSVMLYHRVWRDIDWL